MRNRVVGLVLAQKEAVSESWKYGLQLFADGGDGADGGDDPDAGEDPDGGDGEDGTDGEKKYTEEDVNALIDRKFAEWQKKQEKNRKKQDEAERLKNMTDQERKDLEMDNLRKQVEDLQKKEAMSKMSKTARSMLSDKGITVDDDLVNMLISEDAETTKSAVDSFITAFQNAVNKAVKDALKGEPPKTGGASRLTKEQIMKVKDRTERQRLIQENMHLFK